MEEHWKLRDGNFEGLYKINPEYAKGVDMWAKLDEIINAYVNLHPIEMELQVRANAERIKTQFNDYGSNASKNIRFGASIPAGLMFMINQVYPEVFTDNKLFHKFLKRYKGFRVSKTI